MDTTALPSTTIPAQQAFAPVPQASYQQPTIQSEFVHGVTQNHQQSAHQFQLMQSNASIATASQKSIPIMQETSLASMPSQSLSQRGVLTPQSSFSNRNSSQTAHQANTSQRPVPMTQETSLASMPSQSLPQRGALTPQGSFSNRHSSQMTQPVSQYQSNPIDNLLNAAAIQMANQTGQPAQYTQAASQPLMQQYVTPYPVMQPGYQPQYVATAIPSYLQAQNGMDPSQSAPLSRTGSIQSVNSGVLPSTAPAVQQVVIQPVPMMPLQVTTGATLVPVFAGPPTGGAAMSFQLPYYQSGAPMAPIYGGIAQQMAYPAYVNPSMEPVGPPTTKPEGQRIPSQNSIRTETSLQDNGEDSDEDFFENRRGWGGGSSLSLSSATRK
jgi:hypothetical protein